MSSAMVVIPCYNEAQRLDPDEILRLSASCHVLLVDDGSKDDTVAVQNAIASRSAGKIEVLPLSPNGGKGEAVRKGLLHAIARGHTLVAFLDADLATPVDEMLGLLRACEGQSVVLGSRVALSGRDIHRHPSRHYLGRVFATAASTVLGATIYDTQCGAKVFRSDARLADALSEPFNSRWAFDVELIGRLLATGRHEGLRPEQIIEVPLGVWHDKDGSKVTPGRDGARMMADLLRIRAALRRWRAR